MCEFIIWSIIVLNVAYRLVYWLFHENRGTPYRIEGAQFGCACTFYGTQAQPGSALGPDAQI